ncbi:MAG: hypothetical protein FWE57_04720 [Chitinispirillia bacterium]|nr:hypothetical protein [Chitinispirillia bacterium]
MKKTTMLIITALLCANTYVSAENAETSETLESEVTVEIPAESTEETAVEASAQPSSPESTETAVVESSTEELTIETLSESTPASVQPVAVPVVLSVPEKITITIEDDEPAAPGSKPRIAVYIAGDGDPVKSRALATYILNSIAATGRFTTVERSEVFLAEIRSEHIKQRSGAIDDEQISRLGKQSGVEFVCVADITQAIRGNQYQISARILNVETAEVATVGVVTSSLNTMTELQKASEDVVMAMFRKLFPGEYEPEPQADLRKVKFGMRLAYNNSFVSKMSPDLVSYDEEMNETFEYFPGKKGAGHGFEIAAVTVVRLTDDAALKFAPGFIVRTPYVSDLATISEFAVSIPALFEYRLFNTPVRALAGLQLDIPFGTEAKWESGEGEGETEVLDVRSDVDIGVVLGLSVWINTNISFDVRYNLGLRDFDDGKGHHLNQISAGVSYVY